MKARYACLMRPPFPGAVPRNGMIGCDTKIGEAPSGHLMWGVVEYDRKLSEKEVVDYELEYMGCTDIQHQWDSYEREYIIEHGGWFDDDGMAVIRKGDFDRLQYADYSIIKPNQRTWMIPGDHGLSLLYEGEHFRVEG